MPSVTGMAKPLLIVLSFPLLAVAGNKCWSTTDFQKLWLCQIPAMVGQSDALSQSAQYDLDTSADTNGKGPS